MPFVYDIADLYKAELTIDLSFRMVAEGDDIYDRHVIINKFCDRLVKMKVLENIIEDIESVLRI